MTNLVLREAQGVVLHWHLQCTAPQFPRIFRETKNTKSITSRTNLQKKTRATRWDRIKTGNLFLQLFQNVRASQAQKLENHQCCILDRSSLLTLAAQKFIAELSHSLVLRLHTELDTLKGHSILEIDPKMVMMMPVVQVVIRHFLLKACQIGVIWMLNKLKRLCAITIKNRCALGQS